MQLHISSGVFMMCLSHNAKCGHFSRIGTESMPAAWLVLYWLSCVQRMKNQMLNSFSTFLYLHPSSLLFINIKCQTTFLKKTQICRGCQLWRRHTVKFSPFISNSGLHWTRVTSQLNSVCMSVLQYSWCLTAADKTCFWKMWSDPDVNTHNTR